MKESRASAIDGAFRVLVSPAEGMPAVLARTDIGCVLLVLLLSQVSSSLASSLASRAAPSVPALLGDIALTLTMTVCSGVVASAFVCFFLSISGGRGDVNRLFWVLLLGDAPWMLATPLTLIALGLGTAMPALGSFVTFVTFTALWLASLAYKATGLSLCYQLGKFHTGFVYLLACGTILLLSFVTGTLGPLWLLNRTLLLT